MRIPTGQLNAFLGQLVVTHSHPSCGEKQPCVLSGTQVPNRPSRLALFMMGFLDPGYRRFTERRLREEFGFEGTLIRISMRVHERRRK